MEATAIIPTLASPGKFESAAYRHGCFVSTLSSSLIAWCCIRASPTHVRVPFDGFRWLERSVFAVAWSSQSWCDFPFVSWNLGRWNQPWICVCPEEWSSRWDSWVAAGVLNRSPSASHHSLRHPHPIIITINVRWPARESCLENLTQFASSSSKSQCVGDASRIEALSKES